MGGAIVFQRMNRYVRLLQSAGAVSPDKALAAVEVGIRESFIFWRLVNRGIIVRAGDGKYYVDEEAMYRWHDRRRKLALSFLLAAALLACLGYWMQ